MPSQACNTSFLVAFEGFDFEGNGSTVGTSNCATHARLARMHYGSIEVMLKAGTSEGLSSFNTGLCLFQQMLGVSMARRPAE